MAGNDRRAAVQGRAVVASHGPATGDERVEGTAFHDIVAGEREARETRIAVTSSGASLPSALATLR